MNAGRAIAGEPRQLDADGDTAERDAELVRAAQRDRAEFAAVYHRYVDRLYRYTRTRVGDEQDAMDLTQHVFIKAIDALPRYRPSGAPFSAWLFRIARNVVTDHHRRARATVSWDLLPEALHPAAGNDPMQAAAYNETLSELAAALGDLDADRRDLLALRFAGQLTTREIAAIVGRSEPAVKSDLRRTLLHLKDMADDER